MAMDKDHGSTGVVDLDATKEGLRDGLPSAEARGDQDEDDLALFGKRPQLKVRSTLLWLLALTSHP